MSSSENTGYSGGLNRTCFPVTLRHHFIAFLRLLVILFCPSFISVFPVLPFLFLLLCVDSRWDSRHTGDPEAPAHLREQQRGPEYWQHTKHALLQQQHSLAQRVTRQDGKLCRATTKASHGLVCSSPFKTSFLGFIRWKKYGNKIGKKAFQAITSTAVWLQWSQWIFGDGRTNYFTAQAWKWAKQPLCGQKCIMNRAPPNV